MTTALIEELVKALELARGYIECPRNLAKVDAVLEMAKSARAAQSDKKHWPMQQLSDTDCETLFEKYRGDDSKEATAICRLLADRTFILAQSDEWQPIVTAPKDGTWFLAFSSDEIDDKWSSMEVVRWRSIGRAGNPAGFYDNRICRFCASHWQPLPSSPSKQEGEQK